MNDGPWSVRQLDAADAYIHSLTPEEQIKIASRVTLLLQGEHSEVRTKQLRGPIRELIVGHHRVTYFRFERTLYLIRGFRKKTQKTPQNEIEFAERIYKRLSNNK